MLVSAWKNYRCKPMNRLKNVIYLILFGILACVPRSNDPILQLEEAEDLEVLEYLNDLLVTNPDNQRALYQKALIQEKQGYLEPALSTIDKAIKIDYTNNDFYFLQGKILTRSGNHGRAVEALLRAETLGNNRHELYSLLSTNYLSMEQPDKSRAVVVRLLQMDDGHEAHTLAGKTFLALGDTTAAFGEFQKAVSIEVNNIDALTGLKSVYFGQKETEKAEQILDRLMELNPDNTSYFKEKAGLLVQRSELDSAKELLKLVDVIENTAVSNYDLAAMAYETRHYDSTILYLDRPVAKNDTKEQLLRARSLDKLRKYTESMEVYTAIIAVDSTHDIAISELEKLRRKVSYLQQLEQQRKAQDSIRSIPPPALNRKGIGN